MSFIRKKEESLLQLRKFCSQSKIVGWCSNMWFNRLVQLYPFHFLYYTQYSNQFEGTKRHVREKIIRNFEWKMEKLFQYPINEKDIDVLEKIFSDIQELLDNKKIINN